MIKLWFIFLLLFSVSCNLYGQGKFPKNYFRSPIDYPIQIVGNFGELRNNHFHNGLDIRTGGQIGKSIYAVAEGYVSRIKVSPVGYGNVLYVTHPNGYTSVYAHLSRFNDTIQKYVRKAQFLNETWEIELFPDKTTLPVKKGDIIALSGNTGSSQGPHLHFEIREEESEVTVNPLLFGFDIPDNVPPVFRSVYVYPLGDKSYVNGSQNMKKLLVTGGKGNYRLKIPEKIEAYGTFGFGIDVFDQQSGLANPNGVYSVLVKVDGILVYFYELDKVTFDENRYINSHCDYTVKSKTGQWIQKCFIQPGNKLGIYHRTTNNGYLSFDKDGEHQVTIELGDANNNKSTLNFPIYYTTKTNFPVNKKLEAPYTRLFKWDEKNTFAAKDFYLEMPPYTIYDDLKFQYNASITDSLKTAGFSKTHYVHNGIVPVHSYYTIALGASTLPAEMRSKAVVVLVGGRCEGGEYENGFIKAKTRSFGSFKISIDKTAPTIRPVNIIPGKNLSNARGIVFKISDNLSGLKSYKGYIDGKWVLMEYDLKTASLVYSFNQNEVVAKGRHDFKLVVTDNRDNVSTYNAWFIR